jgi:hypothetical protein
MWGAVPVLDDRASRPLPGERERESHRRESLFLCFFLFLFFPFFFPPFAVYPKAPLLIYKREVLGPF